MNKLWFCLFILLAFNQITFAQSSCLVSAKAISLPKPVYPRSIKTLKETEIVEVKIKINEFGYVISANAISNNPELSKVSETAALNSRFSAPHPLKITGTLKYEFSPNDSQIKITESLDFTEEFRKQVDIECAKLNKAYTLRYEADYLIINLVDRLIGKQVNPNSEESAFVTDGQAKIVVKLKVLNSRVIKELRALGVKITDKISSENAAVGQIPIEKLEALLEHQDIIYVFPFWNVSPPKPTI